MSKVAERVSDKRIKRKVIYKKVFSDDAAVPICMLQNIKQETYALVGHNSESIKRIVMEDGKKYEKTTIVAIRLDGISGLVPAPQGSIYVSLFANANGSSYFSSNDTRPGRMVLRIERRQDNGTFASGYIQKKIRELCVVEYTREVQPQ